MILTTHILKKINTIKLNLDKLIKENATQEEFEDFHGSTEEFREYLNDNDIMDYPSFMQMIGFVDEVCDFTFGWSFPYHRLSSVKGVLQ